jgi:hypothetical protein
VHDRKCPFSHRAAGGLFAYDQCHPMGKAGHGMQSWTLWSTVKEQVIPHTFDVYRQ